MKRRSAESRILALLFFGPPIAVALAVFGPWELDWLPRAQAPYGERYDPPIALPVIALESEAGRLPADEWARNRWSVIFANASACDEVCEERLEALGQVKLALPREQESIRCLFLHGGAGSPDSLDGPGSAWVSASMAGNAAAPLRRALGEERLEDGYIFIADPSGHLVFGYPPDAESEGIVEDLRRLIIIARTA